MTKGCVHLRIKDGKIKNVFSHLTGMPENGVVHLYPENDLTENEFKLGHPNDEGELFVNTVGGVYNLGSENI